MTLHCTIGIHPHDSKSWTSDTYYKLKTIIVQNRDIVVAIGECALDYNHKRMFSSKDQQHFAFKQQIKLALELCLPLFLHEQEDPNHMLKCTVHCFTEGNRELITYINAGFYIGITGWICDGRRNTLLVNGLQKTMLNKDIKQLLLRKIMIETDAPFLSPVKEVRRNQPKFLPHVLNKLSSVLNLDADKLQIICHSNTLTCFDISNMYKNNQYDVLSKTSFKNTPHTAHKNKESNIKMHKKQTEIVTLKKTIVSYRDALLK